MGERVYFNLNTFLEFEDFDFTRYVRDEKEILQPKMEALGFTHIEWMTGETDSFGPLTRTCKARDKQGNILYFMYG